MMNKQPSPTPTPQCYNCEEFGHTASQCTMPSVNRPATEEEEGGGEEGGGEEEAAAQAQAQRYAGVF